MFSWSSASTITSAEAIAPRIIFKPFPAQEKFFERVFCGEKDFVLYAGSINSGKTVAGLVALVILSYLYPGSRWAVVRKDEKTMRRTVLESFEKLCPRQFIQNYNATTQTYTFTNGSQILFFTESYTRDKNYSRWRGLEVNGFLLEEIDGLQEDTFYKAIERSGTNHLLPLHPQTGTMNSANDLQLCPSVVLATCNPSHGWVKKKFYEPYKSGELNVRWDFVPAKYEDSPLHTEKDKERLLGSMTRYKYEMFVEGNWDLQERVGSEFYKEFDINRHVQPLSYNPALPIWLSFDENVHPYFAASVWQVSCKRAMQIDELCMKSPFNTVDGMADEFMRRYPAHATGIFITGDATSNGDSVANRNIFFMFRNRFSKYHPQLKAHTSNPPVHLRGMFINDIFASASYSIAHLSPPAGQGVNRDGVIEIIINDTCKYTILDLQNVKEAADGTKIKTAVKDERLGITYQEYGHLSDCMDYAITSIFRTEYVHYSGVPKIN
jgi:hypothetical protein